MNSKQHSLLILALLSTISGYSSQEEKLSYDSRNLMITLGSAAGIAGIGYAGYQYFNQPKDPIIHVKNLAVENGNFPANFSWGISSSSTQNEETSNNNSWSRSYIQATTGKEYLATPDYACASWTHWQDDIDKVAYLGANSYRFSIEWSRIQPTADSFDKTAIAHYVAMAKYCIDHNIQPMVCLHHYSDPIWFMNMGGFTKEENLTKFENYCKQMYKALCPYVSQWIVISQPVAYAVKSYKAEMMPPFLKDSGLEDIVMLNMFKAHMHVYDMLHNIYNTTKIGSKPQVGICHQIVQMQAARKFNPLDELIAYFGDRLYNQTLLRFFKNGHFQSLMPAKDIAYLPTAPQKFDFFALSYYSPLAFTGTKNGPPACAPELLAADNFRTIDKNGMYDAIVQAAALGKPVYVVENGITTLNEDQRKLLLNSYLSAISQAITDGYDVRGYSYWTLMNDYEWMNPKLRQDEIAHPSEFGLYQNRVIDKKTGQLNPEFTNHEKMLKDGGRHYKAIIAQQNSASIAA